jgi:hypothetical protein
VNVHHAYFETHKINIPQKPYIVQVVRMEKNEFEDLGMDIWMRVLRKTLQSPDYFNEKHESFYSIEKSRTELSMPGQKY